MLDKTTHNDRINREIVNVLLLFSVIDRLYIQPDGNRINFYFLSDGVIEVRISRNQAGWIFKQASESEDYEIAVEEHNKATGEWDGEKYISHEIEDSVLKSVTFHHIFIYPNKTNRLLNTPKEELKMRFLTKRNKGGNNVTA